MSKFIEQVLTPAGFEMEELELMDGMFQNTLDEQFQLFGWNDQQLTFEKGQAALELFQRVRAQQDKFRKTYNLWWLATG